MNKTKTAIALALAISLGLSQYAMVNAQTSAQQTYGALNGLDGKQQQQFIANYNCLGISAITSNSTLTTITTNQPHNMPQTWIGAQGPSVTISGVLGATQLNAQWAPTVLNNWQFTLPISSAMLSAWTPFSGSFPNTPLAGTTGQPAPTTWNPPSCSLNTLLFTRPLLFKGSVTIGQSSYGAQQNMGGGFVTLATGLPGGTLVRASSLRLTLTASNIVTPANIGGMLFNASPTSSFTDGTSTALSLVDAQSYITNSNAPFNNTVFVSATVYSASFQQTLSGGSLIAPAAPVDANGNLYFVLQSEGTFTLSGPNKIFYTVEIDY